MIAAVDVHYMENGCAGAAVLFSHYTDAVPEETYAQVCPPAADYMPGEFYRRELPCILSLIHPIKERLNEVIVDGYVTLGKRPGLGQHLFYAMKGNVPVIGVAKSRFEGASAMEIFRGSSKRPLYVTCAGMDLKRAGEKVQEMHGRHRIPTLLRQVDLLAREKARFLRSK